MNERSFTLNFARPLSTLSLFSSCKAGQEVTLSSWLSSQSCSVITQQRESVQGSQVTNEKKIISLSLICWSCYRESPSEEERGLPSYVETRSGNSSYSCYSLTNNGTTAHVCLSLNSALVFPPKLCVCACCVVPAELLNFMLIMTSVCNKQYVISWHITVWSLKNNKTVPMHYTTAWWKSLQCHKVTKRFN